MSPETTVDHPAPEYRVLPSSQGVDWLKKGFWLFQQQPMLWIGMILTWAVLAVAVMFIPIVSLAAPLLTPLMLGGMMVGCAHLARGGRMEFGHLFAGFNKPGPLLLSGLPLLLAQMAIGVLAVGMVLATVGGLLFSSGPSLYSGSDPFGELLMRVGLGSAFSFMMVMLTGTLLYMVVWFGLCLAPALIILGRIEPWAAVKVSFRAVFANWVPWTLYGLLSLGLTLLCLLTFGLGFLVLYPVSMASFYAAYRDIFPSLPEYLEP